MHKRMTIMLDEAVHEGLYRTIGKRRMSQFIDSESAHSRSLD